MAQIRPDKMEGKMSVPGNFSDVMNVMYPLFLVASDCMIVGYNILYLQLTTCFIYILICMHP